MEADVRVLLRQLAELQSAFFDDEFRVLAAINALRDAIRIAEVKFRELTHLTRD
jgi:hypothetical protein